MATNLYLVGGAVRDLLLGIPRNDRDFVFLGPEKEFQHTFPQARRVGDFFPVFLHHGMEYAPARGPDIQADLEDRDFTINALALDPSGTLYAHPQALDDLRHGVLRPASPLALEQDPARVFRAARFLAVHPDFIPHPELVEAMRRVAKKELLKELAPERVGNELLKALAGAKPSRFLALLAETGCLCPWFQELTKAEHIPAGPAPFHKGNVLSHLAEIMDRLAPAPLAAYMGLCHDLGKMRTDPEAWPHHIGHEQLGAESAGKLGERLRLPRRFIEAGEIAARLHMQAGRYGELRPGAKVDLLMRLHTKQLLEEMFSLVQADKGEDSTEQATRELETILAIRLPEQDRNKGQSSGEKLRMLRAQALTSASHSGKTPAKNSSTPSS